MSENRERLSRVQWEAHDYPEVLASFSILSATKLQAGCFIKLSFLKFLLLFFFFQTKYGWKEHNETAKHSTLLQVATGEHSSSFPLLTFSLPLFAFSLLLPSTMRFSVAEFYVVFFFFKTLLVNATIMSP